MVIPLPPETLDPKPSATQMDGLPLKQLLAADRGDQGLPVHLRVSGLGFGVPGLRPMKNNPKSLERFKGKMLHILDWFRQAVVRV